MRAGWSFGRSCFSEAGRLRQQTPSAAGSVSPHPPAGPGAGRRFVQAAIIALVSLLALTQAGCTGVRREVPREASLAWSTPGDTALGRGLARPLAAGCSHPDPAGPFNAAAICPSGFHMLTQGIDALRIRAELADAARHTLDLQYYTLHEDTTTSLLLWRILRAAGRGVRVRLLLDDLYAAGRDVDLAVLDAHPLIEVRVFNPFLQRGGFGLSRLLEFLGDPARLNRRMHNKLWIADNAAAVVGGRNLGDVYFEAHPGVNFSDLDLLASGPVVAQLSASFDEYWNSDWAVPITAFVANDPGTGVLPAFQARLEAEVQGFRDTPYGAALREARILPRLLDGRLALAQAPALAFYDKPDKVSATATVDDSANANPVFQTHLKPAIQAARGEVLLVSPYFIPSEQGMDAMAALVKRGVRVRVLTNSLAATDVPAVHAGYAQVRERLLAAGVEIHEMRPEASAAGRIRLPALPGASSATSLHAKAILVDRQRLFAGSMNLDPRSRLPNTEVGVMLESRELGAQLGALFDQAMQPAHSFRLALEADPQMPGSTQLVWHAEADGRPVRYNEEPASLWLRLLSKLLGFVAPADLL